MSTTKRKISATFIALAMSGMVAGCGQTTYNGTNPGAGNTAPGRADTHFAKPAKGGTVDSRTFVATVGAAMDKAKTYQLSLSAPSEKMTIKGSVKRVSDSRTNIELDGGEYGLRIVDGTVFVKGPAMDKSDDFPATKPWFRMPDGMSKMVSDGVAMFTSPTMFGPGNQGATLTKSATTTFVGDEGKGAHYRMTVPASAMLDAAPSLMSSTGIPGLDSLTPGERSSASSAIEKQRGALAGKKITFDYWLDGSNRPNQVTWDFREVVKAMDHGDSSTGSGSSKDNTATTQSDSPSGADTAGFGLGGVGMGAAQATVTYSGWGESVSITAPPPAQTQRMDDIMKSAMPSPVGPPDVREEGGSSTSVPPM